MRLIVARFAVRLQGARVRFEQLLQFTEDRLKIRRRRFGWHGILLTEMAPKSISYLRMMGRNT